MPSTVRGAARAPKLAMLVLAVVALITACGSNQRPGQAPRHVLLVTVAGVRPDHLSFSTYSRPTSAWSAEPQQLAAVNELSLDGLASSGVVFANAFAESSHARASAASLLTGQSPLEHGVGWKEKRLSPYAKTLAEAFRGAGFQTTALLAGSELCTSEDNGGLSRGFDDFVCELADGEVLKRCQGLLQKAAKSGNQRCLIWMHFDGPCLPHDPGVLEVDGAPVDFSKLFARPNYTGPVSGTAADGLALRHKDARAEDQRHFVDLYDGEIAEWSQRMRSLAIFLANTPSGGGHSLLEDSVLTVCGLRGQSLPTDSVLDGSPISDANPTSLDDAHLHVPLFLSHRLSLTGSRIYSEVVGLSDIVPTLCAWLEVPAPEAATGRNLLALTDSYVELDFDERPLLSVGGAQPLEPSDSSEAFAKPAVSLRSPLGRAWGGIRPLYGAAALPGHKAATLLNREHGALLIEELERRVASADSEE